MPTSLSKEQRRLLEKTTADARVLAESACRAALENLAVHEKEYRAHMTVEQRLLRNRLRARGRALGDKRDERTGIQDIRHLIELAAYEHWHRLLFTRFLTENHLLIADEANGSVPITLEECEELAPGLKARDGFELACRFASQTLPGVFRRDDPVLDLPLALNDQVELRKLLASLPSELFRADDALGWTYQFWQAQRKDEVNRSGKKIGADELAPVTQLFTEDYMVEFLLHNTLGAWWAGRLGPIKANTEEEARAQTALSASDGVPAISWTYLRFVQDEAIKTWLPAAGTFNGWPKSASLIRLLDPCMGSGHFLVFALPLLVRLRMEEEKIAAQAAVNAVLKDNIHGLEIDERCTQIAAFNVALTAWKLAGYQTLPSLNLACSGHAPSATEAEWLALAGKNERARNGMARLYKLFKDAPVLGSLINPRAQGGNLFEAEFHELAPLLTVALASSENQTTKYQNDTTELKVIAQGLAKAAELLVGQFTLVITNVPYLGRGNQNEVIMEYCSRFYPETKNDLATCFIERCLKLCSEDSGTAALVTPQSWLFSDGYKKFRHRLLIEVTWDSLARLGSHAFETIGGEVVNVALNTLSVKAPSQEHCLMGLDASSELSAVEKAYALVNSKVTIVSQFEQLKNPDGRVILDKEYTSSSIRLSEYVLVLQGSSTGDDGKFIREFWEVKNYLRWKWLLGPSSEGDFSGRSVVWDWPSDNCELATYKGARIQGLDAVGQKGISVGASGRVVIGLYLGEFYNKALASIIPKNQLDLSALVCFFESGEFEVEVRRLDKKLAITPGTFGKVPFDLAHWKAIAANRYPGGLPKPRSNHPTQWLFNGHPRGSEQTLHVAIARLLGYRWPRQAGSDFPDCPALGPDGLESFADEDGIVCLPPVNREQPAAARLRKLLTAALGTFDEHALISTSGLKGSKSKNLEDWLRDEFFEQHSKLFHDRPFIWHLWDGLPDGFHVLINYHKLDHAALQKLTYSYLGNWIQQQSDDAKADKPGAAKRLGVARALQTKLAAILEGEAPLDIFVRWKALKDQAKGWHPDINDGVRQNIRPFILAGDVGKRGAGLFRAIPLALKDKDRGAEPMRSQADYPWFWCEEEPGMDPKGGKDFIGTRWNNVHLTLARKQKES